MNLIKKSICIVMLAVITFSFVGAGVPDGADYETHSGIYSVVHIEDHNEVYDAAAYAAEFEAGAHHYVDLPEALQVLMRKHCVDMSLLYEQYDKEFADSVTIQLLTEMFLAEGSADISLVYEVYTDIYGEEITEFLAEKYRAQYGL